MATTPAKPEPSASPPSYQPAMKKVTKLSSRISSSWAPSSAERQGGFRAQPQTPASLVPPAPSARRSANNQSPSPRSPGRPPECSAVSRPYRWHPCHPTHPAAHSGALGPLRICVRMSAGTSSPLFRASRRRWTQSLPTWRRKRMLSRISRSCFHFPGIN